jgi:hypothetical protein
VRLVAAAPLGSDVDVRVDGKVFRAILGTSLPLDPGVHTIEAVAPRKKAWSTSIDARPGVESTVQIPTLEDEPLQPVAPPEQATPAPVAKATTPPEAPRGSTRRAAAVVVGGVGLAGLAVGSVFGVLAITKERSARDVCPDAACRTQDGVGAHDAARTDAAISTVAFVAGAALTAGGVALLLTAPNDSTSAWLRAGPRGVALEGRW